MYAFREFLGFAFEKSSWQRIGGLRDHNIPILKKNSANTAKIKRVNILSITKWKSKLVIARRIQSRWIFSQIYMNVKRSNLTRIVSKVGRKGLILHLEIGIFNHYYTNFAVKAIK